MAIVFVECIIFHSLWQELTYNITLLCISTQILPGRIVAQMTFEDDLLWSLPQTRLFTCPHNTHLIWFSNSTTIYILAFIFYIYLLIRKWIDCHFAYRKRRNKNALQAHCLLKIHSLSTETMIFNDFIVLH